MEAWEKGLARYESLRKEVAEGEGKLRFGSRFLKASEIASQYYCEKKVELTRIYGRIETEEMRKGTNAHEGLLVDMVKVKKEELWKNLFEKPTMGAVFPLIGTYEGCTIMGVPDYTLFSLGNPLLLVEHKFSKKPTIFSTYHTQALVYGYLLNDLGFDTSLLRYIVAVSPPEMHGDDLRKLDHEICQLAMSRLKRKEPTKLPIQRVVAMMYPFSLQEAIEKLEWAIGFWKGEREAVPTKSQAKCAVCDLKEKCIAHH